MAKPFVEYRYRVSFSFQRNLFTEQRQLLQQRKTQAEVSYQQGIDALKQAHNQGFENPDLLQVATRHFLKTIQLAPEFYLAYLGQAYIYMVLERAIQAKDYVRQVLDQAPTFIPAQQFLIKIHQELNGENTLSYTAHELTEYERIEQDIFRTCLALTESPPPQLANTSEALSMLEKDLALKRKQWQIYQAQIQSLEPAFNTDLLQRSLSPLEALIAQGEQKKRLSQGFLGLSQLLRQESKSIKQEIKTTLKLEEESILLAQESVLERYLDRADLFGDKLNDLAEQGYRVPEVEAQFQELKLYIDIFSNLLDEMQTRLLLQTRIAL